MSTKKKYCYLMPDFPKKAYTMIPLFIINENVDIFPIYKVTNSLDDASEYMKDFVKGIKKRSKDLEVSENCILIPITFNSLYPLERKFWENPTVKYKYEERKHLFLQFASKPLAYSLLVTPSRFFKKKNEWEFSAALPFKAGTSDKTIEQFMLKSDLAVDERASHAAIYNVDSCVKFNWETKKIEIVKPPTTPTENLN